jgi:hypothetical protein
MEILPYPIAVETRKGPGTNILACLELWVIDLLVSIQLF